MTAFVELVCDGCGATRVPMADSTPDQERTNAAQDGWEDGSTWGRADVCPGCADDLRHGRPVGSDAWLGGLGDDASATERLRLVGRQGERLCEGRP